MMNAANLFAYAVERGASDLHLLVDHKPVLRVAGDLFDIEDEPVMTEAEMEQVIRQIVAPDQLQRFEHEKELDYAYSTNGARFRINLHWEKGHRSLVGRFIPHEIPSMEQLGLNTIARSFTELTNGLVLITGPTGAGKSTTLASMLDYVNQTRRVNIITLEDPVEFLFTAKQSIIRQRQLGSDMVTFADGLKHILRQDPDVIMVGEMRDLDTIATTLTLAETGHLVFATLHTYNASQTVSRIIDVFPPHQQMQIRVQLAMTLRGAISQQLVPGIEGGLVAAREVLVNVPACANLIRENKIEQIQNVIQTGARVGMQSYAQDLQRLQKEGLISKEMVKLYSPVEADLGGDGK